MEAGARSPFWFADPVPSALVDGARVKVDIAGPVSPRDSGPAFPLLDAPLASSEVLAPPRWDQDVSGWTSAWNNDSVGRASLEPHTPKSNGCYS